MSAEDCQSLDVELTIREIHTAVASLKGNKSPGPDGLPGELFKTESEKLSPYLLRVFKHAQESGTLPQTLTEAVITVIHKKGKDPNEVGTYRPIYSYMLTGKLYAKTLANRLGPLLEVLIHPNQAGFVPNRNSTLPF